MTDDEKLERCYRQTYRRTIAGLVVAAVLIAGALHGAVQLAGRVWEALP